MQIRWAEANKTGIYRDKCGVIYSITIMEGTWVLGPLLVPRGQTELIFELSCQEANSNFRLGRWEKHSGRKNKSKVKEA